MNTKTTFGRAVKFYRTSRKLSAQKLADELGVSRPYVSQIEGGRYNATLETVDQFAKALGVSPLHLMMEYPENA